MRETTTYVFAVFRFPENVEIRVRCLCIRRIPEKKALRRIVPAFGLNDITISCGIRTEENNLLLLWKPHVKTTLTRNARKTHQVAVAERETPAWRRKLFFCFRYLFFRSAVCRARECDVSGIRVCI